MDFRLTKEQEMMQKLCREFAVNEIEPIAAEIDEEERYPFETVEKLRKYGMMGIQYPKELGGSGGDTICYSIAIEEASKFCGTTGCIMSHMLLWVVGQSLSLVLQSNRKSGFVL